MKLTKFEAEVVVNGYEVEAQYDGDTLSLHGINVEDVMLLLQHVAKFKTANGAAQEAKAKKVRSDKGQPRPAKAKHRTTSEAMEDLKAKAREEKVDGHADRLDKPPADPFVEDTAETQAKDAAARLKHGVDGEEVPPELLAAKDLRGVLLYFSEQRGITDRAALVEVCERWRPLVPVLQRVSDMKARVEGTATVLQIGA